MKIKKLIKNAKTYVNSEERNRKEKKKHLKEVLRKLSKHEKKLRDRLKGNLAGEEKERTEKRLALVHAQRKKGVRLLKELLAASDSPEEVEDA